MGWLKTPLTAQDSFQVYSTLADPQYYVGGVNSSIIANPDLVEDEIVFMTYSRSSHVVGDSMSITLGIKLVANAIPQSGKIYFEFPQNFMIKESDF